MTESGPILFYDGDCGMCAKSVAWCIRRDPRGVLRYAPLQGATYAGLGAARPGDLSTIVLWDRDGLHLRSEAVLRIMRIVGGVWGWAAVIGRLIPRGLRDRLYRFVAERRMGWMGPADACEIPADDARARFLP